jgi:hypothetical protein
LILFDGGLGPAAEWREVSKGGPVVVVRVPEIVGRELGRSTTDRVPLTGRGVDAEMNALAQTLIHHALDEVHVALWRGGPVLGSLHIDPEHAHSGTEGAVVVGHQGLLVLAVVAEDLEAMGLQRVQSVIHLLGGISTRVARENVTIHMAHPSGPGVVDAVWTCNEGRKIYIWLIMRRRGRVVGVRRESTVGIRFSIALVNANNSEAFPVVHHARPVVHIGSLRDIHTPSGEGEGESRKQAQHEQHFFVLFCVAKTNADRCWGVVQRHGEISFWDPRGRWTSWRQPFIEGNGQKKNYLG